MRLPRLDNPQRYAGLFVVDFGETCAVGYTAEEVALLIESEAHADAKVYRIHNAYPDGTMELKGVQRDRFGLEAGLLFHSRDLQSARADFEAIRALAHEHGLPCRAQLMLGSRGEGARLPFVVGLAYPAECDEDMSRWMLDHGVEAGEYADGGIGRLQQMRAALTVIGSAQLEARPQRRARTRDEVFAAVGEPIQRTA